MIAQLQSNLKLQFIEHASAQTKMFALLFRCVTPGDSIALCTQ